MDSFNAQQIGFLAILAAAFVLLLTERIRNDLVAVLIILALYLSRTLSPAEALAGFSSEPAIVVASVFALSGALRQTGLSADFGASTLLAGWLQSLVGGWNQTMILLALFAVVAVLTQLTSDAATTAFIAPVAIALAQTLGQPPEAYVVTVAMAAVATFLTPIGHHGNLLVYGPGGYQFADFVRVGASLTILVALVVAWMAPVVFGH
jgi:di/tricarboxylate transporter